MQAHSRVDILPAGDKAPPAFASQNRKRSPSPTLKATVRSHSFAFLLTKGRGAWYNGKKEKGGTVTYGKRKKEKAEGAAGAAVVFG